MARDLDSAVGFMTQQAASAEAQAYAPGIIPDRAHRHYHGWMKTQHAVIIANPRVESAYQFTAGEAATHGPTLNMAAAAQHCRTLGSEFMGTCMAGLEKTLAIGGIHLDLSGLPLHKDRDGTPTLFAKDMGPSLQKAGFTRVDIPLSECKPGDVCVFDAPRRKDGTVDPDHRAGHAQTLVDMGKQGHKWTSDCLQPDALPNQVYANAHHTIWRPAAVVYHDIAKPHHQAHLSGRHRGHHKSLKSNHLGKAAHHKTETQHPHVGRHPLAPRHHHIAAP